AVVRHDNHPRRSSAHDTNGAAWGAGAAYNTGDSSDRRGTVMPFAAALSTVADTARAAAEAAAEAAAHLGAAPDLAVCFYSPHHSANRPTVIAELTKRLAPRCLLGCVGESVI